jgi:hypothetical protein
MDESDNDILFSDVRLDDAFHRHMEAVRDQINRMPDQAFRNARPDLDAEQLLPRYLWVPLELYEDRREIVPGEGRNRLGISPNTRRP